MGIKDMEVEMAGYPGIGISSAAFEFTPAYASMKEANLRVGEKSDFRLEGKLDGYIPYLLKNETVRGTMTMHSKLVDADDIMAKIVSDTAISADTVATSLIKIPANIDFDFSALIDEFRYGNIDARKVRGHVIMKDGILSLKNTGMDLLDGTMTLDADYDTRDSLKPAMKADMDIKNIGVKDAFNTFNTVQKLAPAAKGMDGSISVKLGFRSLLGHDAGCQYDKR